jgi:hypothetical protein
MGEEYVTTSPNNILQPNITSPTAGCLNITISQSHYLAESTRGGAETALINCHSNYGLQLYIYKTLHWPESASEL